MALVLLSVNSDNQVAITGINFDGNGNPTTYKSATFGFDPEDRLTTISSPAFSAAYDGDGLRAKKTAAGVTTYFVYDGSTPIAEETFNGTSATFTALNAVTADGWRARKQGGIVYQFVYDPQGSVQQRHTDGSYTGGFAAYDRSTFEGYGALRQANKGSTGAGVGQHDPAGFGGQFGYYTDTETGLLCLTHRYYDPGTGKFINRDPIGYQGGANLYGFADGNPINEEDEDGTRGRRRHNGPPPSPYPDPHPSGNTTAKLEASELLPQTLAAIDAAGIKRSKIVQAIGDAPASWGTHYADGYYHKQLYGSAFDISVRGMTVVRQNATVRALREQGIAAWRRSSDEGFSPHIHAIDPITPNHVFSAIRLDKFHQLKQYQQGLNGMTSGRDHHVLEPNTPITPAEINAMNVRWHNRLK